MADKPTDGHVEWITDDDTDKYIEPSAAKKLQGWIAEEKPPFQYFNWFWRLVDRWLQWAEAQSDENVTAIATNATAISDESTARSDADSSLQDDIDAISDRIGGSGADDIPTNSSEAAFSGKSFSQDGSLFVTDLGATTAEEIIVAFAPNIQNSGYCVQVIGKNYDSNNAGVLSLFHDSDQSVNNYFQIALNGGGLIRIDGNGNVGIGKTSGGAKLDIDGEVEATSLTINGNANISGTITHNSEVIPYRRVIEIGDWDMDASLSCHIFPDIDLDKVISAMVWIRRDDDGFRYNLRESGSIRLANSGSPPYIHLARLDSGIFDSTNFDSTGFNRGWVILEYID